MNINRFQAFGWHFLASMVVAFFSAALVFLGWYRWPLSVATGVTEIFALLLAVDVVIGPCITLVIFNLAKKELKRDLAIVVLLQMSALLYGMHTVFIARPVLIVFNVDRFDVVSAFDVDPDSLNRAEQAHKFSLSWTGPETLAAIGPTDPEKRKELLFTVVQGGPDLPQLPEYYLPYDQARTQALAKAKPLAELKRYNSMDATEWAKFVASLGRAEDDLVYLPLRAKVQDGAVILDKANGAVVKMVLLKPW